jgi:hypothetical protein
VSAGIGNTFSIFQATNMVPDNFFVTKGWPSVALGFLQECLHGSTNWSRKQVQACHGIIKFNRLLFLFDTLQKVGRLPVSSSFGIVSVEVACRCKIRKNNGEEMFSISTLKSDRYSVTYKYDRPFRYRSSTANPFEQALRMFHALLDSSQIHQP